MIQTIYGKRIKMSHVIDEQGKSIPASIVQAGPCVITRLKSREVDGYTALQVGFGAPLASQVARFINLPKGKSDCIVREIKTDDISPYKPGDLITCDIFTPGQRVKVTRIPRLEGFSEGPANCLKSGHTTRVTVRGLRILDVDLDQNILIIEGAVPDCQYGFLAIQLQQ